MTSARKTNQLKLLLTTLIFISLTTAISIPTSPSPPQTLSSHTQPQSHPQRRDLIEDNPPNCATAHSPEYHGLGIRLGIYLTWLTTYTANVAVPSEIPFTQDISAIFLFAILIALVHGAATGSSGQVDALVLLHLATGTVFGVLSLWGYRTCTYHVEGVQGIRRFGGWGTHLRLLLCVGVSVFGLFYWTRGVKGGLEAGLESDCETVYTFLFSRVKVDGPIRGFYVFGCVGCVLWFGGMLGVSLVAVPARLRRLRVAVRDGDVGWRVRGEFVTGLNQKQLCWAFYVLRAGNLLFIVMSILLVEFTLKYNHISSALGWKDEIFLPSQLIPLIIGSFGVCRVIWIRYQQWKVPDPQSKNTSIYRTLLRSSDRRQFMKIYSPRSNHSIPCIAERDDKEIDPVMKKQSLGLRLLVTWLPWLGVLRWWKSDQNEKATDLESPEAGKSNAGMWSPYSYALPKPPLASVETWSLEETVQKRLGRDLPQIPKGLVHIGSI